MPLTRHDPLVLTLLRLELRGALRSMRWSDAAWIVLGGGGLLAYGIADLLLALLARAPLLREFHVLWTVGIPTMALTLGMVAGLMSGRITASRAAAPFLKALPLSISARRRMAIVAALPIGFALAIATGGLTSLACVLIAKPEPAAWALGASAVFASGFAAGMAFRVIVAFRGDPVQASHAQPANRKILPVPGLGALDRAGLAWVGAWAWGLPAGGVRPTLRLLAGAVFFGSAAVLSIGASLARHDAVPAALAGLGGGLALFMLSLRCRPLGSPVLRTAPLGFTRAWLRLLRLPFLLSAVFFALPASAAVAAEPSAWAMPLAGGLGLIVLNGTYAVFAAYFMTAPLAAALSFFAALAYANYESLEYGRTVYVAFAALVALLWSRARRRYYHG